MKPISADSGLALLRRRLHLVEPASETFCGLVAMMKRSMDLTRHDADKRATPARRQSVVDALCEAYAQDEIGIQELEKRLDRAHRARLELELRALVADLAPTRGAGRRISTTGSATPILSDGGLEGTAAGLAARDSGQLSESRIHPAQVPDRQFSVGFWSGRVRKGRWVAARRITALALQGGVELDFREAIFGPGTVELSAVAVMGGIQIIVPPALRVETTGFAIIGGFEDRSEYGLSQDPREPTLKIRGFAVMGGIEIDVRLPGETARKAKARRKKERRKGS